MGETLNKHVEGIVKKADKQVYMLYQLKRAGIRRINLDTLKVCHKYCYNIPHAYTKPSAA